MKTFPFLQFPSRTLNLSNKNNTMHKYTTTNHTSATNQGFTAITSAYNVDVYWMLDNAIATLGQVKYLLVESRDGIQIYRKSLEINLLKEERE